MLSSSTPREETTPPCTRLREPSEWTRSTEIWLLPASTAIRNRPSAELQRALRGQPECAPSPPVSSLTVAAPSSPRSVTMSVARTPAPSFWRSSCRLIAMIRSAPSCLAAKTASRPTAPSPATATVVPGFTLAATAPNQPVPSTSEAASRLGTRSSGGVGGGDQGAVGERDPRPFGLGPDRPYGLAVDARALVARPADLAGVVGGEERADHELAGPDDPDLGPDLLDEAGVLMAHR